MANLINVLDPDIVVLGGGVSNFDAIYAERYLGGRPLRF